ncbi:MAG: hypothetical protein PHT33_02840 [bacterium]|nr:hypothetical protein [bacterium]
MAFDDDSRAINSFAGLSLVLGIIAGSIALKLCCYSGYDRSPILFQVWFFAMLLTLSTGIVSLRYIRHCRNARSGYVMSLTGMAISIYSMYLIVMSMPLTGHQMSRKAMCQSNLKQLGMASLMYVQDWGETWMPAKNWASDKILGNYIKNDGVFDCPKIEGTTDEQTDYEYNIHVTGTENKDFVNDPSVVICIADGKPVDRSTDKAGTEFSYPHESGRNILFCDGHVKWFSMEKVSTMCRYRIK